MANFGVNPPSLIGLKPAAEDIASIDETSETKLLSNEQLQRIVLLQQFKVLTLQQEILERD